MSSVDLNFIFNGQVIQIQCMTNDKMNEVFKKFCSKVQKDIQTICFLYEGNVINSLLDVKDIIKNNTSNQIKIFANERGNNSYKGNNDNNFYNTYINNNETNIMDNNYNNSTIKKSKEIICPTCGENCIFSIEDYKINLYKCDNDHNNLNILFEEFNKTQEIDESKIICNFCGQSKIYAYDSQFYKCCNCNVYLCMMCKQKHDKAHVVIDYELKNYLCNVHGERYTSYCIECHKNLCDLCELKHDKYHKLINHRDIIKDNQDNTDDLKIRIDELKKEVNNMIEKLSVILESNTMKDKCSKNKGWVPISMRDDWTSIYKPGVEKKSVRV